MAADRGTVHILLVEDNPGDVRLTREVLEKRIEDVSFDVAHDGRSATDRVRQVVDDAEDAARPDIILLDVGLPDMDGREVLEVVRGEPALADVPVVLLTGRSDLVAREGGEAEGEGTEEAGPERERETEGQDRELWIEKPKDLEGFEALAQRIAGLVGAE